MLAGIFTAESRFFPEEEQKSLSPCQPSLQSSKDTLRIDCDAPISPDHTGFPLDTNQYRLIPDTLPNTYIIRQSPPCPDYILQYEDKPIPYGCNGPLWQIIVREWTLTDTNDNTLEIFIQPIGLKATSLTQVLPPPDYDNTDRPPLDCEGTWPKLGNGAPSPDYTQWPTRAGCSQLEVEYEDLVTFNNCNRAIAVDRTWSVLDRCTLNSKTFVQRIEMTGCHPDTSLQIYCYSPNRLYLDSNQTLTISVRDFAGATSNCGINYIAFDPAGNELTHTFSEKDLGNNSLMVWAKDFGGNIDSCLLDFEIVRGVYPSPTAKIWGMIKFSTPEIIAKGLSFSPMIFDADSLPISPLQTTFDTSKWFYQVDFDTIGLHFPLLFFPNIDYTDDYPLSGINTRDLIKLQQHILGKDTFSSRVKLVASDVNCDHEINVLDIVKLRLAILKNKVDLCNGHLSKVIVNPGKDIYLELPYQINQLPADSTDLLFVQLGEVALHKKVPTKSQTRGTKEIDVYIPEQAMKKGKTYTIRAISADNTPLEGYQIGIHVDTNLLSILNVESSSTPVIYNNIINKELRILAPLNKVNWEHHTLFIQVKARHNCTITEALDTASHFSSLAADLNVRGVPIRLHIGQDPPLNATETTGKKAAIFIAPNPLTNSVRIVSEGLRQGVITIYDTDGRLVHQQPLPDMRSPLQFDASSLGLSRAGVYFIRITSNEHNFFRKVVKM